MADGGMTPQQINEMAAPDMAALFTQGQAGNVVQTCPKVILEIGVFFDGTGNNERNAQVGGTEGSFANARSNVSLLKELYYPGGDQYDERNACGGYAKRYSRLYVQGIGTSNDEEDDLWGMAMGVGERGVENRVIRAALDVGQIINRLSPGIEPEEIVLDVFGFSRGAAAARHFVNGFNAGQLDYSRWGLFNDIHARLPEGRNVRLRFVGIFDTVAAIGTNANDANNQDVNVHLNSGSADTIFHLTANDEIRHSFSLNDNQPGGGEVERLPGVHSDVGGGYHQNFREEPVIKLPDTGMATSRAAAQTQQTQRVALLRSRAMADAAVFVAEGWITPADVPTAWDIQPDGIELVHVPGSMFSPGSTYYTWKVQTRLKRPWVRHELSRIALKKMYEKAVASDVPMNALPTSGDYAIPAGLEGASAAIKKRNYTHHSANYNDVYPIIGAPMREGAGRRRTIHRNQAGLAK
ncbi:T6SS phospholipase effector Tle1-like catalytic domain-containing protein [Litoreibacter janthinus]|uniref:Uncharacterized alpha/beta hydrolase domain n=1 Tax=Litoreibacter janthinus TaxID=670154 RepID=A0A1I6IDL3_9RHOB|nr:DUF2235 domain-containing protein [Litoreibacter janthinus]SFR64867.1 Uncharacterized alpha/beta hydrolase domain [Litoreibacter janthinus]